MTTRFADPGVVLTDFATHFVVHCPKCGGKAHIASESQGKKLTCTACFHVEQEGHWYGAMRAFVNVKCRECHAAIHRSADWNGQWKKLATRCDECGDTCEYPAQISKQMITEGRICDPVFGLPLWLQKEFRDDLFWAYNYEHLEFLNRYIAAKLRERGIEPGNKYRRNNTMISRLPAFIKKAGNRDALQKIIQQLIEKQ